MSGLFTTELSHRQPLACQLFDAAIKREQLVQAYLLIGRAIDDKWSVARELACYLNCSYRDKLGGSCLSNSPEAGSAKTTWCQNCRWISENAHPQAWLALVESENKSGKISVEKARLLTQELAKTSEYFRVVVVPDASAQILHRAPANALLKTVEEAAANILFLFFATDVNDILATIVSRCQIVPFTKPLGLEQADARTLELLAAARDKLAQVNSNFLNMSTSSAEVSSAIEWARLAEKLCDDELSAAVLLDALVGDEVKRWRDQASLHPQYSLYLLELGQALETAREQIDSYVQLKAVLETFALTSQRITRHLPEGLKTHYA